MLIVLIMSLLGCTAPHATTTTLKSAGYTAIEPGGYQWFTCGSGDIFHTKFEAINPAGVAVSGTVCCGVLKGCTVRF